MAQVSLVPGSNFTAQLKRGVLKSVTKEIFNRIAFNSSKIIQQVGNLLALSFESTEVAQALRGNSLDDLPAHFGLSDSEANQLVVSMSQVIRQSISITTSPANTGGIINVNAVPTDYAAFLELPNAKYVSSPSNISIPVMAWLLLDPDIDIGQAAFDIVFLGDGGQSFDDRIEKVSRSGRAIMVTLERLGGGGGYILPAIVRGNAGANFIEFALRQPNVASEITKIVVQNIR